MKTFIVTMIAFAAVAAGVILILEVFKHYEQETKDIGES
jgi:hypothetical protein